MLKLLASFFLLFLFSSCSFKPVKLYYKLDPSDNNNFDFYDLKAASYKKTEGMLDKLIQYQLVFVGDHHDQDDLHEKIAQIIVRLTKKKKKVILAAEWFTPKDNSLLQSFIDKKLDEKVFLKKFSWKKKIGFKYASFRPIFKSLQDIKGRLVGINLSKKEQKQISARTILSMSEGLQKFYHKLDTKLEIHKNYLKPYLDHCYSYDKGKEDCLQRMYRVQVAWDSKMADEVLHLEENLQDNEILLVLVGSMHLSKNLGLNLRFSRISNRPFFNLLPIKNTESVLDLGEADAMIFYSDKNKSVP